MRSIVINGVTYRSLAIAARAFGITHATLVSRLKVGRNPGDPLIELGIPVTICGIKYDSKTAACKALHIDSSRVGKLARGLKITWEAAATRVVTKSRDTAVTAFGRRWPSLRQAWLEHKVPGVPIDMVYDRIYNGWDVEVAICHAPVHAGRAGRMITFEGVEYGSITAALEALNIIHERGRFMEMTKKGISHDDAMKEIVRTARPLEQCKR